MIIDSRADKQLDPQTEKIPHRQPGPVRESSAPLSPFEPARVVRHNQASMTHAVGKPAPSSQPSSN